MSYIANVSWARLRALGRFGIALDALVDENQLAVAAICQNWLSQNIMLLSRLEKMFHVVFCEVVENPEAWNPLKPFVRWFLKTHALKHVFTIDTAWTKYRSSVEKGKTSAEKGGMNNLCESMCKSAHSLQLFCTHTSTLVKHVFANTSMPKY